MHIIILSDVAYPLAMAAAVQQRSWRPALLVSEVALTSIPEQAKEERWQRFMEIAQKISRHKM